MIGRLTGDINVTCDNCGAVLLIRNEYSANLAPAQFCPMCGTPSLRAHSAPIKEFLAAKCFNGVDPVLVQLLYSVWGTDADVKAEYPRFVDYLNHELEA
jgi:hypothetical protein